MKIKRYLAASMRAALARVRAEQGPDAVILSSRRTDDGIEVIAAVDYDEALFAEVKRQRAPSPASAPPPPPIAPVAAVHVGAQAAGAGPLEGAPQPAAGAARATASESVPTAAARTHFHSGPTAAARVDSRPAPTAAADVDYRALHRELADLRHLLETGLAGIARTEHRPPEPMQTQILDALLAMDIEPDVAMALAARAPPRSNLKNPANIPLALLLSNLAVVDDAALSSGGVVAIVGPTGAGKTTTIAKLAARWCTRHGRENFALVSTDGYRVGARDQLTSYARLLGAPLHAADSGRDLSRILDRLKSKKLILIDTAGMGPRDVRLTGQLAALRSGAPAARVLLALPAQGEGHALGEIVRSFAPVAPVACILTKVDESASLGAVISAALRHRLKVAYVCDGQRVPEDLHTAQQRRVWLVRTAAALTAGRAPPADAADYFHHFGRAPAHA